MIRAKTLLASVTIVTAAAFTFALNSSHDEFVPEGVPGDSPASNTAIGEVHNASPYAVVSHLPKLAPPPRETPGLPDAVSKTVIELDVPDTIEVTEKPDIKITAPREYDLQEKSKSVADALTADRAFANLARKTAIAPKVQVPTVVDGMPLPTRAPKAQRGFELESATSNAWDDQPYSRRKSRRKARRTTQRRVAANAKKFASQKVSNLSGLKSKPVSHREPFDANRN